MEKKGSFKAVAAVFLGVSLVGLFMSVGATSATAVGSEPAPIVEGP